MSSAPSTDGESPRPSGAGKRQRLAAWLHGNGIEIGALHRPLKVPRTAHVTYVDRLPQEVLRAHYSDLNFDDVPGLLDDDGPKPTPAPPPAKKPERKPQPAECLD